MSDLVTMRGVDVSKWQGSIDWYAAFTHGVDFAICKATQGLGEVDAMFANNAHALRHYGYRRGWYHFPDARNAPGAEADRFLSVVGGARGEVLMLDVENDPDLPPESGVLNLTDPVGWVAAWCERVISRTSIQPLVYLSGSQVARLDWGRVSGLNCGLDVASWGAAPVDTGAWAFYAVWQDGNAGHYPGIGTAVDTDVFNGGGGQWDAYAHGAAGAVSPPPPPQHVPAPPALPDAYTVRAGDTLSGIADAHGVSVGQLVAWNFHRYPSLQANPGMIWPGWVLVVGTPRGPVVTYTVQPGDTLSGIASRWGLGLGEVESVNPQLGPPYRSWDAIFPGDVVRHP